MAGLHQFKSKLDISVFFFIFTSFLFIGAFISASELSAEGQVATIEWTVNEGESLWSIAESNVYDDNMKIQEMVYWIKDINDLDSSIIFPGQTLDIPTTYLIE